MNLSVLFKISKYSLQRFNKKSQSILFYNNPRESLMTTTTDFEQIDNFRKSNFMAWSDFTSSWFGSLLCNFDFFFWPDRSLTPFFDNYTRNMGRHKTGNDYTLKSLNYYLVWLQFFKWMAILGTKMSILCKGVLS